MAKTPLFSQLLKSFSRAALIEQNPRHRNQLLEAFSAPTSKERREMLKCFAGMMAMAPISSALNQHKLVASLTNYLGASTEPVVILGAGVSGLTAAYRLMKAGIKCEIYEASSRVGGRIFTRDKFNSEGMFCELGGELIDTGHTDLLGLANELGVAIDDFVPYDKNMEGCHFYFAGVHYYEKEVLESFAPLARILRADMLKVFGSTSNRICNYRNHNEAATKIDRTSLKEYLYSKKGDVDKWVLDLINVAYLGEYGDDTEVQSALNLLLLIGVDSPTSYKMYDASDESKRIKGGNSRLIEALEAAITPQVPIHLGMSLVKIENKPHHLHLHFQNGSQTLEVKARQSICTIPFTLLRDVEGLGRLNLSPTKLRCIRTLGYGKNSKYMLGFQKRLWRESQAQFHATTGYTYTDLPAQTFWDTSRLQTGNSGILTNFMGGSATLHRPTDRLNGTLTSLEQIYPGVRKLHDGNEAYFQWATFPHSKGSYTCPSVGQVTTLIGSPAEPELGNRLFFAGEHVSESFQGYMNGAVESANASAKALIASLGFSARQKPSRAVGAR